MFFVTGSCFSQQVTFAPPVFDTKMFCKFLMCDVHNTLGKIPQNERKKEVVSWGFEIQ